VFRLGDSVTSKWHIDEAYIKVRGQWMYLYRAIDSVGDTVEFWFSQQRDLSSAKRFFRNALARHGRPDRVVIDGCQTKQEAILSCDTTNRLEDCSRRRLKPIRIRKSKYLTDVFDKDRSALMSWKSDLRAFCSGGWQRQRRAASSGLGLDGASTSPSFAATDGTAKLILLLCHGSGDRVAKNRVEVATLSRSL
jgi:transposase-like protein